MTMGPVSSPQFSLPSIPVGAQIAVNEVNAAGGINGHKVQLIACNDENNPTPPRSAHVRRSRAR